MNSRQRRKKRRAETREANALIDEWLAEPDDKDEEWWNDFEAELARSRQPWTRHHERHDATNRAD